MFVGIDLGTTFSAVAKIDAKTGKAEIIRNEFGSPTTPSVLGFLEDGTVLYGDEAKALMATGDPNTIAFFKRYMGSSAFGFEAFGTTYSATDLSAIFLQKLVEEAGQQCGEKIDSAVITVPAYFTHKERQATMEAGEKAGLKVLAIINEPTSAAFAYGLNNIEEEQTVLIYDLGGGTFDVTVAKINSSDIEVLGTDGNHQLGGKDWDDSLKKYLVECFQEEFDLDITEDLDLMTSLTVSVENAKKQLSSRNEVAIPIAYQGKRGKYTVTNELFEQVSEVLIEETKFLTNNLIQSINLSWSDITGVILVGGSTRMRMVKDFVTEMSGKPPLSGVNVDEAVALGAAIKASTMQTDNAKGEKSRFAIGGKNVSDVTAHAMGMIAISEDGERYENSVIISKNSKIPAESKKEYHFNTRNTEMEVYVLQGQSPRCLDNIILNKYVIENIEKTSGRETTIEVAYQYTADGIVQVHAIQQETGKELSIRVEPVPDDMSWTDGSPKDQITEVELHDEMEIMLAVDLSGSMSGRPVMEAAAAMRGFTEQFDSEYVKIGLIGFADKSEVFVKLTNNYKELRNRLKALSVGSVGYGNSAEPFALAMKCFSERTEYVEEIVEEVENVSKQGFLSRFKGAKTQAQLSGQDGSEKAKLSGKTKQANCQQARCYRYVVVLTDGCWDTGASTLGVTNSLKCQKKGIEVIALGFGGADARYLKQIASTDDFASLTTMTELSSSFNKIAQVIKGDK